MSNYFELIRNAFVLFGEKRERQRERTGDKNCCMRQYWLCRAMGSRKYKPCVSQTIWHLAASPIVCFFLSFSLSLSLFFPYLLVASVFLFSRTHRYYLLLFANCILCDFYKHIAYVNRSNSRYSSLCFGGCGDRFVDNAIAAGCVVNRKQTHCTAHGFVCCGTFGRQTNANK